MTSAHTCQWYVSKRSDNNHDMYADEKATRSFLYFKQLLRVISRDYVKHTKGLVSNGHITRWGNVPFNNRLCASNITLFPEAARMLAISLAASNRRSSKNPLFVRIASPINSALRASPWARTIID